MQKTASKNDFLGRKYAVFNFKFGSLLVHPFALETRVGSKLFSNLLLDLDVLTNLQYFYIVLAFGQVLNVLKRQGKNDNSL